MSPPPANGHTTTNITTTIIGDPLTPDYSVADDVLNADIGDTAQDYNQIMNHYYLIIL